MPMPRAANLRFFGYVWDEIEGAINLRNIAYTLGAVVTAGFMLTPIVAASLALGVDPSLFTLDSVSIANISPFSGVLSNLGALLWCASMSICLFSALILRNVANKTIFSFLLNSGILSGYLLFDDLFLFHEFIAQRYLGIKQVFVVISIVVAIGVYLISFYKIILKTNFILLSCSMGFLGLSVVIDQMLEAALMWRFHEWSILFEDGPKWIGIFCWFAYLATTAQYFVRKAVAGDATVPPLHPDNAA